jgi:hypothetical protein
MEPMTTWPDLLPPGDATHFFCRRRFPPFEPHAVGHRAASTTLLDREIPAGICR